jgi:DNA-binding transcriptional MerR regulator
MDWSIQQTARIAGTTSRTLRHYDDIGLLKPSRIAQNGYRHYDQEALVQLQRILLLRELGLGLPVIAEVLRNVGRRQGPERSPEVASARTGQAEPADRVGPAHHQGCERRWRTYGREHVRRL